MAVTGTFRHGAPQSHPLLNLSVSVPCRPDLMVKKLRYYARFIVVCLLLKKMKLVRDLVRELAKHIDEYTATYEPDDQLEWSMVLSEIKAFIEADNIVNVLDSDSNSIVLSHRWVVDHVFSLSSFNWFFVHFTTVAVIT